MFIIGLLRPLRARTEAEAKRRGCVVSSILSDVGANGTARLLPIDSDAVYKFRHYLDCLTSFEDAFVLVLPYAPIPEDLEEELQAFTSLEGRVVRPKADGLDLPRPTKRPDTMFFNAIFAFIACQLHPENADINSPPSAHFLKTAEDNTRLLIAKGALDYCDAVAKHRWRFLTKAADAFASLLQEDGLASDRLEVFFKKHGLTHAQSGGINAKLQIYKNGELVHQQTSNTHLKQGDHTTAEAAARIYYQCFSFEERFYIVILYAGPHPDDIFTCRCDL